MQTSFYTLANAPPRPKLPLPALPAFPLTEPFSLDNELSVTFMIAQVFAPFFLQKSKAAIVSAVSPD